MQVSSETQGLHLDWPSKTFPVEWIGHYIGMGEPAGRVRRRGKSAKWYDNSYQLWVFITWKRAGFMCSPTGTPSHLVWCSPVTIWKSLIVSEQGAPTFRFALGPTDYVAGPAERHCISCFTKIIPLNQPFYWPNEGVICIIFILQWTTKSLNELQWLGERSHSWLVTEPEWKFKSVCFHSPSSCLPCCMNEGSRLTEKEPNQRVGEDGWRARTCWAWRQLMFNWGGGASHQAFLARSLYLL